MVGLVRGVQGLRGAVRVEVLTDEARRFEPGSVLHPEGSERSLTVAEARQDGPGLVIRFQEIASRDGAEQLRDIYLEAGRDEALPAETYYWHEIVGCSVRTTDGQPLGVVDDVMRVGEAEVFVVRGPGGELLVPAVKSVVRQLSPETRAIVVDAVALGLEEG